MNLQPDIIACPNCKARNYSNQAVCFNCGAALPGGGTGPQYQQGQQPQPYPPPYPYPQKKGSGVGVAGGIGIGVIVGVLLVVLLCVGGVLFVLFSFGRAVTEIATITSNNYEAKTFDV